MFSTWKTRSTRTSHVEEVPMLVRPLGYRRFLRSVFQAPARLNLAGAVHEVQLLDVSLKGALVDLGEPHWHAVGTRGRLRVPLSPAACIAMDVQVTRRRGSEIGLECLHIDLDSVTHLRQLIERNAQDPTLLGRELAVLIGSF